jgi:hypothetical protein
MGLLGEGKLGWRISIHLWGENHEDNTLKVGSYEQEGKNYLHYKNQSAKYDKEKVTVTFYKPAEPTLKCLEKKHCVISC